jgi:flagellar biosynthesis chaperone FliJ
MSEIRALREIEGIRIKRVDQAEEHFRLMQKQQREAEQALINAKQALEDYQRKLPGLIEQLYADCMNRLVSREFLAEKTYEETQLRARVEDYKAKVTEAEKSLEAARRATLEAQRVLNLERVKLDAMRDLIKAERQKLQVIEARAQAKVLDELASSKFVRKMRKAA